jgi:TetR/AcrR family acrAB operon transcriptional repressor
MAVPGRPARPQDGRRDLTDIAIDCFARYGYQSTSIDRIAKAAGLTKGAIYYYFKDKEDLLFAAVKNRVSQFEHRVAGDVTPIADPAAALRKLAEVCFDHATKSNHRRFIVTLMIEALDNNARLSAQFREMMQRFRAFLTGIIEIGQKRGTFRADVSAITAAGVYAGAVMGAEIQYYQDPKATDLEGMLKAFIDQYLMWLSAPAARAARRK